MTDESWQELLFRMWNALRHALRTKGDWFWFILLFSWPFLISLGLAFGFGYSVQLFLHDNKVSKLESEQAVATQEQYDEYQAEKEKLKQRIKELESRPQPLPKSHDEAIALPTLEEAPLNPISMTDYFELVAQREEENRGKFGLDKEPVYDIGTRFEWEGEVSNIQRVHWVSSTEQSIMLELKGAICIFSPDDERLLSGIKEGDRVKITGVMGAYGLLYRCKLLSRTSN